MTAILVFLLSLGCVPTTEIVVDPMAQALGFYKAGVVIVRSLDNETVLVHELYHSCQPIAHTHEEWINNEVEARMVEEIWREYNE